MEAQTSKVPDVEVPQYEDDVTDIDEAVTRVFAKFPGDTWRLEPLRDVVTAVLRP